MSNEIELNSRGAYASLSSKQRGLLEEQLEEHLEDQPARSGLFLTDNRERLPIYGPVGGCETVFSRKRTKGRHSGARIVLTRDNYGSRASGLGGAGGTRCEAIDIVAGQLTCERKIHNDTTKSRGNFATDGARIYLTERGDINHYFALGNAATATNISSAMKSGIGIKADHTLVIGRERVRILVGGANFDGGERLANGAKISDIHPTIELGSIRSKNMQPAVRGKNLIKYIDSLEDYIQKLVERIDQIGTDLYRYKVQMSAHTHITTGPVVAIPSIEAASFALTAAPGLMNDKTKTVIDMYNKQLEKYVSLGIPEGGIAGSLEDNILSNTVFIGE
jgi:hypothetical protein